MGDVILLVGSVAVLAVLFVVARAVAREQKLRRDEPYDRRAVKAERHARRQENAAMMRTMLFGRWADGGRRVPVDDPDDE